MTDTDEKNIEDHLREIRALEETEGPRENAENDQDSGSSWDYTKSSHGSSSNRDSRKVTVDYRKYGKKWATEALVVYFAFGVLAFFFVRDGGVTGGVLTFLMGLGLTYWIAIRLFKHIDNFTNSKIRKAELE